MDGLSSTTDSSLDTEDEDISSSDTEDKDINTPKKRRFSSRKHGFNTKRAAYYHRQSRQAIVELEAEHRNKTSLASTPTFSGNESLGCNRLDSSSSSPDSLPSTECLSSDTDSLSDCESVLNTSSTSVSDVTNVSDSETSGPSIGIDYESDSEVFSEENPLFEGCSLTPISLYTLLMLFAIKHSLSKDAFSDLIHLVAVIVPTSSKIAKTIYKLKETLKKWLNFNESVTHHYCDHCQANLPNSQSNCSCTTQDTKVLEFYELNVEHQIQELLKDEGFCEMVMTKTCDSEGGSLSDICDGSEYERIVPRVQQRNTLHLSFTLNTDGVAIFSSSKKGNLWPVYLAINELPVQLRFSRKYLMPCYLHCHVEKPDMLTYLSHLMNKLRVFSEEGMDMMTSFGKRQVKCHLVAVCVDLPARALVSNMKLFNGKQGCIMCFDEGQTDPNCQLHRYYPFNESNQPRTHHSILQDARKATLSGQAERGIKGASPLLMLKHVDLTKVFPIDWMHCVLLGITKALLQLWLGSQHKGKQHYIGEKVALLDKRLLQIQIPNFVGRRQRSLEESSHWKASECREWLFHYSVPILNGVLPPLIYAHYCLLVSAMALLASECVTPGDIDYAEQILHDFYRVYPDIYGAKSQTMNLHMLRHLADCVRQHGPLFNFSCFGFESMNGHLKSMIHGTRHVNSQITFAVAMTKSMTQLVKVLAQKTEDVRVHKLFDVLTCKFVSEKIDEKYQGVVGKISDFPIGTWTYDWIRQQLQQLGVQCSSAIQKFSRFKSNGKVYSCKEYERSKFRNDYSVVFSSESVRYFGCIQFFIKVDQELFAVIEMYNNMKKAVCISSSVDHAVLQAYKSKLLCHHIMLVEGAEKKLIPAKNIQGKCIFVRVNTELFVTFPPNTLEHN